MPRVPKSEDRTLSSTRESGTPASGVESSECETRGERPRKASPTIRDILRQMDRAWRHFPHDRSFWQGECPRSQLVEQLETHLARLKRVEWTDEQGVPRRTKIESWQLELIRESGAFHILAHLLQHRSAEIDWKRMSRLSIEETNKAFDQLKGTLAEAYQLKTLSIQFLIDQDTGNGESQDLRSDLNDANRTHESQKKVLAELRHQFVDPDRRRKRGRPKTMPQPGAIRTLFVRLLECLERNGLWGDLTELEASEVWVFVLLETCHGHSLAEDARKRVRECLWGQDRSQPRSARTAAQKLTAAILGHHENRIRENLNLL